MSIGSIGPIKLYQPESAVLMQEWYGLLQVQLKQQLGLDTLRYVYTYTQ